MKTWKEGYETHGACPSQARGVKGQVPKPWHLVDSAAAFASHCDAIDASGALKKLCVDNGLLTFSNWRLAWVPHSSRALMMSSRHLVLLSMAGGFECSCIVKVS